MSYQTITNFKSDFQNFQLNLNQNSVKEISVGGEKSTTFAEMLSSYKEEPIQKRANETQKSSENSRSEQNEEKNSFKTSKSEEKSQKISENENADVEKSSEEIKENGKFFDKNKTIFENKFGAKQSLKKENVRDSGKDEKKFAQIKKNQKDDKKIKNRDFDRINRLGNDKTEKVAEENAKNFIRKGIADNLKDENQKSQAKNDAIIEIANSFDAEKVAEIVDAKKNIRNDFENSDKKENKSEISDFKDLLKENRNAKNDFYSDKSGKIAVKDLRTFVEKTENQENPKKSDLKISKFEVSEDGKLTINMELNRNANADVLSLNNQTAAANGSDFQAMLNNQIQSAIPEFVKAGNIVLKDNDQGQINLVLHPDDLGNVKIHLSLDGKTISGNIIVTSKEALQVFKDNAETLREAFVKNGFDAANFEVAYNNSGSSANQNFNSEPKNDGTLLFAKKVYSNGDSGVAEENSDYAKTSENYSNYSVNIVA